MRYLMPLTTLKIRPEFDASQSDNEIVHATIAHEMLEHAKSGHAVVLAGGEHPPVMAHPEDDLGDLTARVADALSGQLPEEMEDAMDEAPLNPDGSKMSKRQRAAHDKAAAKAVGSE